MASVTRTATVAAAAVAACEAAITAEETITP
jgi:hypothetical protein